MTNLQEKISEYRHYLRLCKEAEAVADALKDELKAYMRESGKDEEIIGEYRMVYQDRSRNYIRPLSKLKQV